MDLQKLIAERDRLVAEAEKMLKSGAAGEAAFRRPVELQETQLGRVEERIAGLEASKAELTRTIDAELKELKQDVQARRRQIERDRKEFADESSAGGKASAALAAPRKTAARKTPAKPAARKTGAKAKRTTARKASGRAKAKGPAAK